MGARKKSQNGPKPRKPLTPSAQQSNPVEDVQSPIEDPTFLDMSHVNAKEFEMYNKDQLDMFFVVQSMYPESFEQIYGKRDPWQKHDNLAFTVTVSSLMDRDGYAKIEFDIPFQFPKVPVRAKLLYLSPHTSSLEKTINHTLATYAKENLHEAAITEMITMVQDKLDQDATDRELDTKGLSLEAERAHQAAVANDHKIAQREYELRLKEEAAIEEEKRLKAAILREKQIRHGKYTAKEGEGIDESAKADLAEIPFRFKEPIYCYAPEEDSIQQFSAVFGVNSLLREHRVDKKVTVVHPVRFGRLRQGNFVLKEIFVRDYIAPKEWMESTIDRVRSALEDCKSATHANVAKLYAYEIEHDTTDEGLGEWRITILTEQAQESGMRPTLKICGSFEAPNVRQYTEQILSALDYLEKLGHPHPAVSLENMFYWHSKEEEPIIKLTDGYGSALRELVEKGHRYIAEQDALPDEPALTGWTPPELMHGGEGWSSKTAIWQFGICFIKMSFSRGLRLEEVHTSVESLLHRDDFHEPFKAFLRACFQSVPRKRPTPSELLSHKMLKGGSQSFNIPTPENPSNRPHLLRSGELTTRDSAWDKLWTEIRPLGTGGFGQVFRARYLADGQAYAVKRLIITERSDVKDVWSEVSLLAQLDHPNVVRYFNTWQEDEHIEDRVLDRVTVPQSSVAQSVRNRLLDPSTLASREHDFMDPSMHRNIGAEYSSDEEQNESNVQADDNNDTDDDDDNDDSGGMFGYQSPPEDIDEDDEALQDDPFTNSNSLNNLNVAQTSNDFSDNIQFGDDTSSANQQQKTNPDDQPISPVHQTPARHTVKRSIIYIQMELCETGTLKDEIAKDLPSRLSDVWRIMREIAEGLEHIHFHGVVHRDLKPTNIFIDRLGRTKIGDFGLAIASHQRTNSRGGRNLVAGSERGVGTQWYVAPELEYAGSGEYSSKADMFSLGVIFFQMCLPIKTEYERQNYLNRISKDSDFQLPPFFDEQLHKSQGRIISSLITHDQSKRMSSVDLLKDPDLPENIRPADLHRGFARMAKNNPEAFTDLRQRFYDIGSKYDRMRDRYWQTQGEKSVKTDPVASSAINDQLRDIFQRHGAVESERNTPFPVADFYSNAVQFLDDDVLVQLPFDLTYPFARILADAEERPEHAKNYCFGTVYRRGVRGVAPTRLPEVDYDHISYSAKDLSLKDAEVIKVLDEVLTEITALAARQFLIIINHDDLLDIILQFAQIERNIWDDVKSELSQLNIRRIGWKQIRTQLLSSRYQIKQSSISRLEKFNFQCSLQALRDDVNRLLDEDHASKAAKTLARLEELMSCITAFGVKTRVLFSPLSNNTEHLYRGSIMFKALETSSRKIFAVGGRYDQLIESFPFGESKGSVRAVGFRINVSVLTAYVKAEDKGKFGGKNAKETLPSRVDVIVTSFDEAVLRAYCVEVYSNLLSCGIRAELSEHYDNMPELDRHYKDLTYLLVIVRAGNRIKVRNPSKEEVDVKLSELTAHIKSELGDRNGPIATEAKLGRVTSSHTGEKASQRVTVCVPSHKDKKANRAAIVDAAATAAGELADHIGSNSPIVAISTTDEVLESMRNTRLADDGTWRALRQSISAGERQYLVTVQELLQAKMEEGAKGAFVVNYRTNTAIFYDFGKK